MVGTPQCVRMKEKNVTRGGGWLKRCARKFFRRKRKHVYVAAHDEHSVLRYVNDASLRSHFVDHTGRVLLVDVQDWRRWQI